MKIILFVSVLTLLTFGCAKKEEAQVQIIGDTSAATPPNQPGGPQDPDGAPLRFEMLPPHMRAGIAAIDRSKLRTPESAAQVYLVLPDSVMPIPIPPPLRPFTNPKMRETTDTSAVYVFTMANKRTGEMLLRRIIEGGDTIWIPMHIIPH